MAGGDPLNNLLTTTDFDIGRYPNAPRRRRDPMRMVKFFERMEERDRREQEDAETLERLRGGTVPQQPAGFGELREAEAKMAEQERLLDPAEREKWLDEREAALAAKDAELTAFADETLALTPGDPEIRRRASVIDAERTELESARQQQSELRAELERAKGMGGAIGNLYALTELQRKQIRKGAPIEALVPDWLSDAASRALGYDTDLAKKLKEDDEFRSAFSSHAWENREVIAQQLEAFKAKAEDKNLVESLISALMIPQEGLAGLASIPAEALALALDTGARGRFEQQGTPQEYLESALNPLSQFREDDIFRRRGREMGGIVGRNLAELDLEVQEQTGMSPLAKLAPPIAALRATGLNFWEQDGAADHLRSNEFIYRLGFELSTDPLNIIDFGGSKALKPTQWIGATVKAFKAGNVGKALLRHAPELVYMPEKFWLRLEGHARTAATRGDAEATAVHAMERAFAEGGVGVDALRLVQDSRAAQANAFRKLTPAEAEQAQQLLPVVVEQHPMIRTSAQAAGDPMTAEQARRFAATQLTESPLIQQALVDAATHLDDLNPRLLEFERRYGMGTHVLDSEFGYYMTLRDPKFQRWLATHREAQRIFLGTESKLSVANFESAMAAWEKGRLDEWRHLELREKEALIREQLARHGLPPSTPIFSRDAFENIAKRAEADLARMKERNYFDAATQVYGIRADAEALAAVVREAADKRAQKAYAAAENLEGKAVEETVAVRVADIKGPQDKVKPMVKRAAKQMAQRAEEAAQKATKKADASDFDSWTPQAKARYVQSVADRTLAIPAGYTTALKVFPVKAIPLPESLEDLSRLATTALSPDDAVRIERYAAEFYPKVNDISTAGAILDGLKVLAQRSTLGRVASAMRDVWGTLSQAIFAADDLGYLSYAMKSAGDLGGNPITWSKGLGRGWQAPDDVLQLMSEGVLNTTVDEATRVGNFAKLAERAEIKGQGVRAAVAGGFAALERKGVLGAPIPGKAGEVVKAVTDVPLHARVWFEQVQRLATYRQAVAKGASHADAVEEVYKHWGRFDEITGLERKVISRILFFWAWRRATLPIALRNLLDHPVRSRIVLWATAYTHSQAQEAAGEQMDNEAIPEWFRRMGGWILGVDESGNADAVGTGGSTYFAPTVSLLQSDFARAMSAGDLDEAFWQGGREVIRGSPPHYQQVLERLEEKDYFTGDPWTDPVTGEDAVRAPTFLYWFMSPDDQEPNAFEKLLGLRARRNKDGQLRDVVMDPVAAWWMDWIPGAGPMLADVSSMADPRMADTETGLGLVPGKDIQLSLGKGALRQAGIPMYRIHLSDQEERQLREARNALTESLDDLSGGTLVKDQFGNVAPNPRNERGRKLAQDRDAWHREARQAGMGRERARSYVDQRMIRLYFDEWRVIELDRRLQALQGRGPNVLAPDAPLDAPSRERIPRQRGAEAEREDREFRRLLGITLPK